VDGMKFFLAARTALAPFAAVPTVVRLFVERVDEGLLLRLADLRIRGLGSEPLSVGGARPRRARVVGPGAFRGRAVDVLGVAAGRAALGFAPTATGPHVGLHPSAPAGRADTGGRLTCMRRPSISVRSGHAAHLKTPDDVLCSLVAPPRASSAKSTLMCSSYLCFRTLGNVWLQYSHQDLVRPVTVVNGLRRAAVRTCGDRRAVLLCVFRPFWDGGEVGVAKRAVRA
jgi:hypothetical protein